MKRIWQIITEKAIENFVNLVIVGVAGSFLSLVGAVWFWSLDYYIGIRVGLLLLMATFCGFILLVWLLWKYSMRHDKSTELIEPNTPINNEIAPSTIETHE